jgi:hypothetical protein
MCWQEIEIGVLDLSIILDVMINIIGGNLIDRFEHSKDLNFVSNQNDMHTCSEKQEAGGYFYDLNLLIVCFVSYKKWVQGEYFTSMTHLHYMSTTPTIGEKWNDDSYLEPRSAISVQINTYIGIRDPENIY